jgi:hypothetical protein
MLLTKEELLSLVGFTHQSPHTLLGMQPLGDGPGLLICVLLSADTLRLALAMEN